MRHYTPTDQQVLESTDADLGSTSPALLPSPGHGKRTRYLLQGGKDGKLRLLKVPNSLFGVTGSAGQKLGGGNPSRKKPAARTATKITRRRTG